MQHFSECRCKERLTPVCDTCLEDSKAAAHQQRALVAHFHEEPALSSAGQQWLAVLPHLDGISRCALLIVLDGVLVGGDQVEVGDPHGCCRLRSNQGVLLTLGDAVDHSHPCFLHSQQSV